MALIATVVPVSGGYAANMQDFLDAHPWLTLNDIDVHRVDDASGIYLTYDNANEPPAE